MPDTDASYIATVLRDTDPDRYYASLVLPIEVRPHVQALHAFSADVAAISGRVRDSTAGEIRLQWWRDALAGDGHGDVERNPLAAALLAALRQFGMPPVSLLQLIEARSFDLYADPMPDLPAFEGYAGATVSVPYQVAAMMLNDGAPVEPGDAAGHLGVAHAMIGHLRAFGYHASRGRIFLPWSVLAANGVEREELLAGTVSQGLLAGLQQLQEIAGEHLGRSAAAIDALPRTLRPAFAAVAILRSDLEGLRRTASQPFAAPLHTPAWRRIAALAWWSWRNG